VRLIPALLVYLSLLRVLESLFVPTSWLSQNNLLRASFTEKLNELWGVYSG